MKYSIIYADCPWTFTTRSSKGKGRSAEKHYQCMTLEDIKRMDIQSISQHNCALFFWVTYPCLEQGLSVIKEWGFEYKTCAFSWVKLNKNNNNTFTGMGFYTRANNEICLLATKGKPLPRLSHSVKQIVMTHIGRHSEKPAEVRERIVQLFGDLPRVELFARERVDGWDAFGNEIEDSITIGVRRED